METRRGFLKLLGSLVATTTVDTTFGKQLSKPKESSHSADSDLLWRSYFPTLKQNEGEKFNFYRCSNKKLTVGYGCNIEKNQDLIKDIVIFHKGKPMTDKEKSDFLKKHKEKTDKELENYSISKVDAVSMVKKFTYTAIDNLVDIFRDEKNKKSVFFNLPVPMQILALDIYFNVGRDKFLKYQCFKTALLGKDYDQAVKESTVYTGKKKTNKDRERRKKRLLSILKTIQRNPKLSLQKVQELVEKEYCTETPMSVRILSGKKDRVCENAIVCGEFERIKKKLQLVKISQSCLKRG